MKNSLKTVTILIALSTFSCGSNCSNDDFDIIGEWDVKTVEFIDQEGLMEKFCQEEGVDYDEYLETTKLFERVEFNFQEKGVLALKNPEEMGGDGETTYNYSKGSDKLVFGGHEYGFRIESCEAVVITDFALGESTLLEMHCERK